MSGIINNVIASLNFLSLLWSIFIIVASAFLIAEPACSLSSPVLELMYGFFLLVLSVVAMIGAIRNNKLFLSIYLWALVGWMVEEVLHSTLSYVSVAIVSKAERQNREYNFNEYPAWLRNYGVDGRNWNQVKDCMVKGQFCYNINFHDHEVVERIKASPIGYGCCQPPPHCGFVYKNDTVWTVPKSGLRSKDSDCKIWSNHVKKMCYDCSSCKAGHLVIHKHIWLFNAFFNLLFAAILAIVLSITCCAYRKAVRDSFEQQKIQA